jgi:nucleotide-binding universal stress UspA family protein
VARLLVGSVSQACLDHATVPVVIVRARAASAGPRDGGASAATTGADRSGDPDAAVVVGVDGSDPSIRALRFAADEAALRGVPLRVLHAWPLVAAPYVAEYPGDGVEPEEAARQVLDRTVHSGLGGRRDIEVRAELAHGPAVRILLEESAGASLLVVGSRGRGGFAELLLGSTSHQVASHASCPVAVVRGPEATDGGGRS